MKIYVNTIIADDTDEGICLDIEPTKIIFENLTEENWVLDKMDFQNTIDSVTCDQCKSCGGNLDCWNCKSWHE